MILSPPPTPSCTRGTLLLSIFTCKIQKMFLQISSLTKSRLKLPYLYTWINSLYDHILSFGSITILYLNFLGSGLFIRCTNEHEFKKGYYVSH